MCVTTTAETLKIQPEGCTLITCPHCRYGAARENEDTPFSLSCDWLLFAAKIYLKRRVYVVLAKPEAYSKRRLMCLAAESRLGVVEADQLFQAANLVPLLFDLLS